MEGTKQQLIWWPDRPGSAWLLLSSSPFPVRHTVSLSLNVCFIVVFHVLIWCCIIFGRRLTTLLRSSLSLSNRIINEIHICTKHMLWAVSERGRPRQSVSQSAAPSIISNQQQNVLGGNSIVFFLTAQVIPGTNELGGPFTIEFSWQFNWQNGAPN